LSAEASAKADVAGFDWQASLRRAAVKVVRRKLQRRRNFIQRENAPSRRV